MNLIYEEESFILRKIIYAVYNEMGTGFLENVYQECLEVELIKEKIPFESKKELNIFYKGEKLKSLYIPDLICYNKIIIELKSVKRLNSQHKAQILNYLKATDFKLGFLVNFGFFPTPEIIRIVN